MNPDKIRNVLNILFMILALAAIIVYFVVGKEDIRTSQDFLPHSTLEAVRTPVP